MSGHKPPNPVSKTFLLCREIFQDVHTKDFVLIGPILELTTPQFPFLAPVSVFGLLTSLHGTYRLKVHVEDAEGVVWGQEMEPPLTNADPLLTLALSLKRLPVNLPRPGKFDMVLFANGTEVARYTFAVGFPKAPAAAAPAGG